MKALTINIIFDFHESLGGGNQFLKALKKKLIKLGIYESNPIKADCFIFNSHHNVKEIISLKKNNQDRIFIHRVDGPTYLTKIGRPNLDYRIYELNQIIADGTIFQSKWSMKENYLHGFNKKTYKKIIYNS